MTRCNVAAVIIHSDVFYPPPFFPFSAVEYASGGNDDLFFFYFTDYLTGDQNDFDDFT